MSRVRATDACSGSGACCVSAATRGWDYSGRILASCCAPRSTCFSGCRLPASMRGAAGFPRRRFDHCDGGPGCLRNPDWQWRGQWCGCVPLAAQEGLASEFAHVDRGHQIHQRNCIAFKKGTKPFFRMLDNECVYLSPCSRSQTRACWRCNARETYELPIRSSESSCRLTVRAWRGSLGSCSDARSWVIVLLLLNLFGSI